MEQAGQGNRARDHAQKHKKSKPKYVPQTEKSNSDVPWKSKSKPLTSPIDLNKKMIFQKTTQNHELVKMEADKKILEKERRVYPEIPGLNIEKSSKDLQRCSASISRYRQMVKEEVESSVRNIKSTFAEMYKW
ncbi:hypothetical protein GDO86_017062 [Hymenochirus boettgeri]|uniref:Uncharacterized protein n=1 Tax=Hymenochirus boettgeri TaxID=247094 RepID=A0A8T2ILJ1_9PIPI|nr:hypothetical protein GDO86_017062 [Hymenochirus boettgeri]